LTFFLAAAFVLLVYAVFSRTSPRDADDEDFRKPRKLEDAPKPVFHGRVAFADRKLKLSAPELTFLVIGDWCVSLRQPGKRAPA